MHALSMKAQSVTYMASGREPARLPAVHASPPKKSANEHNNDHHPLSVMTPSSSAQSKTGSHHNRHNQNNKKVHNLSPLGQSASSPTSRWGSREGGLRPRPTSPAFERAFACGKSLNRVSLTAPLNETALLRSVMPASAANYDLNGTQLAKMQRLIRKAHEKQIRDDPKRHGVGVGAHQPRAVLKLVAMEELVRDEFVKERIERLPYSVVNHLCTAGDEYRLRLELAAGVYNVNQRDGATGRTALICACAAGHGHIARMLVLEHHADVNRASLLGDTTPLHFAAIGNYRQIASMLITFGADVHARNLVGATPLHLAHSAGVIKLLLRFKASPVARTHDGLTPLGHYRYQRPELEDRSQEVEEMLTAAEDKFFQEQTLQATRHLAIEAPLPQAPAPARGAKEFMPSGKKGAGSTTATTIATAKTRGMR